MEHLLEILKIVEGAVNADRTKVIAYTEQLAAKLDQDGHTQASSRLRRTLRQSKTQHLAPSFVNNPARIPVDNESRLSLAHELTVDPADIHLFLEPEIEARVAHFVRYVQSADLLLARGVDIPPSLIAYGPPGCGKTLLAHYIAGQLRLPLLTARLDSLISSFLGSTAKNLRTLFDHASSTPCVLFLDEFDAIAKLRDDHQELGELKRVVVSLLQNIDILDNKTILIAATNHEHLLDPAVWRRFSYKIEMPLPSPSVRAGMFAHFLGAFISGDTPPLVAAASEGLSGSDIRAISDDAKRDAILCDESVISPERILRSILLFRGLIKPTSDPDSIDTQIVQTRDLDPKVFTYPRLSKIFDRSTGYICNLLKGDAAAHA